MPSSWTRQGRGVGNGNGDSGVMAIRASSGMTRLSWRMVLFTIRRDMADTEPGRPRTGTMKVEASSVYQTRRWWAGSLKPFIVMDRVSNQAAKINGRYCLLDG